MTDVQHGSSIPSMQRRQDPADDMVFEECVQHMESMSPSFALPVLQTTLTAFLRLNSKFKTLDECAPCLQQSLSQIMRMMAYRLDQSQLLRDALCRLVDTPLGADVFLRSDCFPILYSHMSCGASSRTSALFTFCCVMHCPITRNAFAERAANAGLVEELMRVLETYADDGKWSELVHASLLALNWFGGSDFGARYLVPFVPRIVAAWDSCSRPGRSIEGTDRSACIIILTMANLSAYMDEDEALCRQLVDNGIVDPLLQVAKSGVIADGSVGALMGLINLRQHAGSDPRLVLTDAMLDSLLACLKCSLFSIAQSNILWSPWHPAQALGALMRSKTSRKYCLEKGLLSLLLAVLDTTDKGTQAEPDRDERYALKALKIILQYQPEVLEQLQTEQTKPIILHHVHNALTAEAKQYAKLLCETLGYNTFFSLKALCRRALRRHHGAFDDYRSFVMSEMLPVDLKRYLLYEEA